MAIRFEAADGRFVRLEAVGYEHELKNWPPDNWLMIHLDAFDGENRWQRSDAGLEVHDLSTLAQFMRTAAERWNTTTIGWGATEPDIELTAEPRSDESQLLVTVRLNSHFHRDYDGEEPCMHEWIELLFDLTTDDMLRIANDADEIVRRFPEHRRA